MALVEPFDLLPDFPGWTTKFELRYRQEQSRTAGGRTIVKDMGSPLWEMTAQSKSLHRRDLDFWRARLDMLEGGKATFWGYPLSRTYPIAHPRGSWPTGGAFSGTTASLSTVNENRKAVRIGGLPAGFRFSIGDMISIAGDLHRVMEPALAGVGGVTPEFEIRPHLWPNVEIGSPPPVVSVYRPSCLMAIVPGSISSDAGLDGRGSIVFQAIEARL